MTNASHQHEESPPVFQSRSETKSVCRWLWPRFLVLAVAVVHLLIRQPLCAEPPARPNVLVMMVDDLGYSDLGCYGSEIATPWLDELAGGGLRFSQFYNTAKCHSSRVCLLTGQYCLAAGDTSLKNAVTSAEVLRANGYFTAMTGKWHLQQQPTDFGFDRYFGHLSGACNYFRGDNTFRLNGKPWQVPAEGFYTTVANVDFGLKFLQEADTTEKPWHLYVAFNAPHAPLQALPKDYAKYADRYDAGWDVVRAARVQRQRELGILPANTKASPRPEHIPAWETLTKARQDFEIKRMTTLAAMIDRVDQEVGRLIEYLKATNQLDNTLIWFVSDNGACPYDRRSTQVEAIPTNGAVSWSDSTGWAWARNSPFRYYKQNQFEGGIGTPAIVHWPKGLATKPGSITRQPAHLIDVLPTLADVTNSRIPETFADRDLRPISGISLKPLFQGKPIERKEPLHFLFAGDRGLRDGDWKAVSFRKGPWELYNLREDRTELHNLADSESARLQKMIDKWHSMASDVLHASGGTVAPVSEESQPHQHREWTDFSRDPGVPAKGNTNPQRRPAKSIRARKNTTLSIRNGELQLAFTGDDPGLAFDSLPRDLPAGPYVLSFELSSSAAGDGDVFFTTDTKKLLPRGTQVPFDVTVDEKWHAHEIKLKTQQRLHKLRLDVSDGKGTARIRALKLVNDMGKELIRWPTEQSENP